MLARSSTSPTRHAGADGSLGRDFDNWAICDTACFHLFDRTPHAWRKVEQWAAQRRSS